MVFYDYLVFYGLQQPGLIRPKNKRKVIYL
jgi:hypothetical protein